MELKMHRLIILAAVSVAIEASFLPTCDAGMSDKLVMESPRQKIPDTPLFIVTPISTSSVFAFWSVSPEDYNQAMTYTIQYYPITNRLLDQGEALQDFKNITFISTNSVEQESAVIDDLMKGTEYRFRILASNQVGSSQPSDMVRVLTEIDPPPQVEDVKVLPSGFREWEVTWRLPSDYLWPDQILGYQILPQTSPIDDIHPFPIVRHISHSTKYTLTGLAPSTLYTISIAAYNSAGLGPSTFPISLNTTQLEPPVAPINFAVIPLSSRTVQALWEIPFGKDKKIRNSTIQYYPVYDDLDPEWRSSQAEQLTVAHDSEPSHEKINIIGLQPGTSYRFRMFVTNDAGSSPPSNMVVVMTDMELPTETPQNIQVRPAGFGELKITWDPLLERMGVHEILGYRILWKKVTSNRFSQDDKIETSSRGEYILAGLESSTTYEIVIAAYNDAGVGPFSFRTRGTTRKSESDNPLNIYVQPPRHFVVGDSVKLHCRLNTTQIESTDPIVFVWWLYKDNGEALELSENRNNPSLPIYITRVAPDASTLTITNFQPSDARDYICLAMLSEEKFYKKEVGLQHPL
ncbi:receptor-type tyrosine-protein phosphatase F-like isoform X2 [Diachasmimorpha longicaudata]|uniref:receptor-type tyrosine-protein phosphatase F-like isoform X2 n=1 Tax=Diachasmimorpha longicaudata TaxID=58733 RepID=UPI0030B869FA